MSTAARRGWWLTALVVGCGAPAPPASTGGTDVEGGVCGRGLVVVGTDYQSTSIALVDWAGEVLSPRFITSGSTDAGLSAPLSGDVVAPQEPQRGDTIMVVDRYPASVITWVDVASADVVRQVDVRTGFTANPQDAVEEGGFVYVSRLDANPTPGAEPFDGGSDVVVLPSTAGAVVERIDLAPAMADAPPSHLPRPNRMVVVDGVLRVVLSAYDAAYLEASDSRLVSVEPATRTIVDVHVLDGLRGCTAIAEVGQGSVAVACTGEYQGAGNPDPASSGVVVLDPKGVGWIERRRWWAADLGGRPMGFSVARLDGWILATSLGDFTGDLVVDRLLALPLDGGDGRVVIQSEADAFVLGHVRCPEEPACGPCWLADAERGVLWPVVVGTSGPTVGTALTIDDGLGLPPRTLGAF